MIISKPGATWLKTLDSNGKERNICKRLTTTKGEEIRGQFRKFMKRYESKCVLRRRVHWKYTILMAHLQVYPLISDDLKGWLGRQISNFIHDLECLPTGLVSVAAIEKHGFLRSKYTKEHFYSRQGAGEHIVRELYIMKHLFTFNRFVELVNKYRQVHWTTKDENGRLTKIQTDNRTIFTDWQMMYRQAGIQLVDFIETRQLYINNQDVSYGW